MDKQELIRKLQAIKWLAKSRDFASVNFQLNGITEELDQVIDALQAPPAPPAPPTPEMLAKDQAFPWKS